MRECRFFPWCSYIEDHGCTKDSCRNYQPMPDAEALLALAKGLDSKADDIIRAAQHARFSKLGPTMGEAKHEAYEWRCIARRIRKALGVVDGQEP